MVPCHPSATAHTHPPPLSLLPMVMSGRLHREISVRLLFEAEAL